MDEVKVHVADVRNEIPCERSIEREVRIATCNAIDELIIQTIKRAGHQNDFVEEDEFV